MSSGSDLTRLVTVGLALVVLLAGPAAGQSAPFCFGSARALGWTGIDRLVCNCTVQQTARGPVWSFRSEPRVLSVIAGSPAAGIVQAGDEIVAVNGEPITTVSGGRMYGAASTTNPLRLTVRRDGRLVELTINPTPICPTDERAEASPPQAFGEERPRTADPAGRFPRTRSPLGRRALVARGAPPWGDMSPLRMPQDAAWFGFGITCSGCDVQSGENELPRWSFEENPRLIMVEAGTPADRAGLREGDELIRIDGIPLRSADGGRRFGAVRPGERVRWTYRRDGQENEVTVEASERPMSPQAARVSAMVDTIEALSDRGEPIPPRFLRQWQRGEGLTGVLPRSPLPEAFRPLRFRDFIGGVEVEVFGSPGVVTTIVEAGRDLIIDTGDARIRIRARGTDRR